MAKKSTSPAKRSDTGARVRRSPVALDACGMATAVDVLGDRWSLLVLRSALYGVSRFEDFQAELKVARGVLSDRLAALVDAGLLAKVGYQESGDRPRSEYRPTGAARELGLVFAALQAWGDRWLRRAAPPISPRDTRTGKKVRVVFATDDGEVVPANCVGMG